MLRQHRFDEIGKTVNPIAHVDRIAAHISPTVAGNQHVNPFIRLNRWRTIRSACAPVISTRIPPLVTMTLSRVPVLDDGVRDGSGGKFAMPSLSCAIAMNIASGVVIGACAATTALAASVARHLWNVPLATPLAWQNFRTP